MRAFFWFFADDWGPRGSAFGPGVLSHLAPRTSGMARLRLRGARLRHRFLHLGVSRGDLGVHPRCSDTSSAFEKEGRSRGLCI